jgi:hypothetical protein
MDDPFNPLNGILEFKLRHDDKYSVWEALIVSFRSDRNPTTAGLQ